VFPACLKNIFIFIVMVGLLASCATTRHPGHDVYLKRNSLAIDNPSVSSFDIDGFIQQKPSKKLFFSTNLNLWLYNYAIKGKEIGFKSWLKRAVVEKPVVLDTNMTNQACRQIKLYMDNIGYYHGKVDKIVRYHGKYAKVKYRMTSGKPYNIRHIKYLIGDTAINRIITADNQNSLLNEGMIYNAYTLDEERNRITMVLKNEGYYGFAREYINYRIDSSLKSDMMDVTMFLNNPKTTSPAPPFEQIEQSHSRYKIRTILINTDYDPLRSDSVKPDTLQYLYKAYNDSVGKVFTFLYYGKIPVRPLTILHSCFITPENQFNIDDVNQTYSSLSELQFLRYINIDFTEAVNDTSETTAPQKVLDCSIQLSRNSIQSFSFGMEGTNSGGDFGVSANPGYLNRNLFHGSELLNFRLKGAMEIQRRFLGLDIAQDNKLFNTYELGVNASLVFPKFLLPLNTDKFSKYFRPKSTLTAGFNYLQMATFKRYLTETTFGYSWKSGTFKRYILNPLEVSSISILTDSSLMATINSLDDKRLQEQYTDHLITATRFSFVYNNQLINKKTDFMYFKSDFESAGGILNAANDLLKSTKDENGNYTIYGIRYSQYVKGNLDFRYYHILRKSTLAYRTAVGLGIAYGNSIAMPFDKGFYAGGANGMRGWAIRSLGPGSYNTDNTTVSTERMGDLFLESNIEFRFAFTPIIKGAFFTDLGNVWMLRTNEQYPGGEFHGDTFFKEIAMDAGFGLRFDFSFFVMRVDGATPVRNPSLPEANRWTSAKKVSLTDIMWNFGIGYPF
jgi:outer membrane protein assembly factor BamA